MIKPDYLKDSGIILKKGKEYKADLTFLVSEDMDANVIYEIVARAIVKTRAGRTLVDNFRENN